MNPRSSSETKNPSLRTRLREATATAILEAAEEVFADRGLHAASMNDIAAKAGVAVGTLYNHFKDKDALVVGLFEMRRAGMLERVDEQLKIAADFKTTLINVMTAMFDYFRVQQRFFDILWHQEPQHEKLSKQSMMMPLLFERFEKLMKRGVKERVLDPALAQFHSSALLGLMKGMGICAHLVGREKLPSAKEVVDLFLNGAGA